MQQLERTDEARSSKRLKRTRLRGSAHEGVLPIVCEWETKEDEVSEKHRSFSGTEWESGSNLYRRFYSPQRIQRPGKLEELEVGRLANMIYSQFTMAKTLLRE